MRHAHHVSTAHAHHVCVFFVTRTRAQCRLIRKSNNVCQRTVSKDLRDALVGIPIYACEVLILCLLVPVCCRFAHKPLAFIVTKTDCNWESGNLASAVSNSLINTI